MTEILIDTNILVYVFDTTDQAKRRQAVTVVRELQNRALGCLSIQCLSEFFNAATRGARPKLSFDSALESMQDYLLAFPTFPLTPSIVLEAARGARDHSISFYDAQIWGSAMINDIPLVFSEDFGQGGGPPRQRHVA